MKKKQKFVLKAAPEPKQREMRFHWDEAGGAHIFHDDDLTFREMGEALAALVCIAAANYMIEGGLPAVVTMIDHLHETIFNYLGTPELARIRRLPTEEEISAAMEKGRGEVRKEGLLP